MTKPMGIAASIGLLLALFFIVSQGPGPVFAALASVGLGAVWIILVRGLQIAGAGLAWWIVLPDTHADTEAGTQAGAPGGLLRVCVGLRGVREAINTLLPVAQIGGEIIGARLLTLWRVGGGLAAASVLTDLLLQTATQLVFSLVGVLLLAELGGGAELLYWLSLGLLVMTLAVAGFFLAQRLGGFYVLERMLVSLAANPRWGALASVANLHHSLQLIHQRHGAMMLAGSVHLLVWFVGALEIWIALAYMGYCVPYKEALAIESLGHAIRATGFLIPGGLGVQEGGFLVICGVLGIPAPVAVALSLIKRVPEIVLGVPGLFAWRMLEGGTQAGAKNAGTP
jgi:putative membrane protein